MAVSASSPLCLFYMPSTHLCPEACHGIDCHPLSSTSALLALRQLPHPSEPCYPTRCFFYCGGKKKSITLNLPSQPFLSVQFSKFHIVVQQISGTFHLAKQKLSTHSTLISSPPPPVLGNHLSTFCFWDISYEWNHTIFVIWELAYVT